MRSEKIAKTILTKYYSDDTGAELGSKLVQCCKRVKQHCTNRRSRFTDVVRKSTTAILVDPQNAPNDENQSDEENTNSQETYSDECVTHCHKKRRSKGGYIMGKFSKMVT
jgi:hypothetical protein